MPESAASSLRRRLQHRGERRNTCSPRSTRSRRRRKPRSGTRSRLPCPRAAPGERHPHRDADEHVAHHAAEERLHERQRGLGGGDLGIRGGVGVGVAGEVHHRRDADGADQIRRQTTSQLKSTSRVPSFPSAHAMARRLLPVKSSAPATTTSRSPRKTPCRQAGAGAHAAAPGPPPRSRNTRTRAR